ncbi:MAG: hypothetical protein WC357_09655 [Candidatus Omnitrophota bacterium]
MAFSEVFPGSWVNTSIIKLHRNAFNPNIAFSVASIYPINSLGFLVFYFELGAPVRALDDDFLAISEGRPAVAPKTLLGSFCHTFYCFLG